MYDFAALEFRSPGRAASRGSARAGIRLSPTRKKLENGGKIREQMECRKDNRGRGARCGESGGRANTVISLAVHPTTLETALNTPINNCDPHAVSNLLAARARLIAHIKVALPRPIKPSPTTSDEAKEFGLQRVR
jgi:hypothetical protein